MGTDFYITDHSADSEATGSPNQLLNLYIDIARDGITSVRYDWRWNLIEPRVGQWSEDHLSRYAKAKEIMATAGLQPPTIILSSPPSWATKLYKRDRSAFFDAYSYYVNKVVACLKMAGGTKVRRVQVFNELNNRLFTSFEASDLPELCSITRKAFASYNPDVQLLTTLLVGNVTRFTATPITSQYLRQFKAVATEFDAIGIDYYPGLWHINRNGAFRPKTAFKYMVVELEPLRNVFEELARWDQDYELAEIGIPSKRLWGGELGQLYFYVAFFHAYARLLQDFDERGLKRPTQVGLYAAIDEAPTSVGSKLLRKFTPFPEHDLGMRHSNGERKLILQGNRHCAQPSETSQLQRIIRFVNQI